MRRGLQYGLALAASASAAALLFDEAPRLVAPLERHASIGVHSVGAAASPLPVASSELSALPSRLDAPEIEPAKRDIFSPVALPAPPAEPASAPVMPPPVQTPIAVQPPPPAPPPPAPPALPYRYLGSMLTPGGQRLVMLARGQTAVPVTEGTRLDEGYVVEAVTEEVVRLVYPALGSIVLLEIPQGDTQ